MPRKIPDLEEKIIASAGELFIAKGYQNVSMKDVAHQAGTSVGNLYNYFPAKKDLFLVGRRSWLSQYGENIQTILAKVSGTREDLEQILIEVLNNMEKWSGLYEEFLDVISKELSPEENQQLKSKMKEEYRQVFVSKMDSFLRDLSRKSGRCSTLLEGMDTRMAVGLLVTVKSLVQFHGTEQEANRQFIHHIVEFYFGNGNISGNETSH